MKPEVRLTGKRDKSKGDECGDSISGVVKVDLGDIAHHKCSDKDQDGSRGKRRDVAEDRSEEDRDEEPERGSDGAKTGSTTFTDTTGRFDERCGGTRTEE